MTALNGSPRSSSPIQYSKKSPRMYSASAARPLSSNSVMKRSFASGRSSVRWRSEMKSVLNARVLLFLGGNERDCFDNHRLARHVARERSAGSGRRLGDLGHHVLARHHPAEHRVAVAIAARVAPVQERVVRDVDEKLRGG